MLPLRALLRRCRRVHRPIERRELGCPRARVPRAVPMLTCRAEQVREEAARACVGVRRPVRVRAPSTAATALWAALWAREEAGGLLLPVW